MVPGSFVFMATGRGLLSVGSCLNRNPCPGVQGAVVGRHIGSLSPNPNSGPADFRCPTDALLSYHWGYYDDPQKSPWWDQYLECSKPISRRLQPMRFLFRRHLIWHL